MPFRAEKDVQGIGVAASLRKSQHTVNAVGLLAASPEYKAYVRSKRQGRQFVKYSSIVVALNVALVSVAAFVLGAAGMAAASEHAQSQPSLGDLVGGTAFYMIVWSTTYFEPSRIVTVFVASVMTWSNIFSVAPPLRLLPRHLNPHHLTDQFPLVRLVPFLATFLPGFLFFYMRLAVPHWRRKPIVWSPALYSAGIAALAVFTWSVSGRLVVFALEEHPTMEMRTVFGNLVAKVYTWVWASERSEVGIVGHAVRLVTDHNWLTDVRAFGEHSLAFAVTYGCCAGAWAVVETVYVAVWERRDMLSGRTAWGLCTLMSVVAVGSMHLEGVAMKEPQFLISSAVLAGLLLVGYRPDLDGDDEGSVA